MFDILRQDIGRGGDNRGERLKELVFNTGMWAVVSYRFRRWVFELPLPRLLKLPLTVASMAVQLATEVMTHIQIPCSVKIGPGLYIAHTGYIVISSSAELGSNCTLTQGVTIGHGGGGDRAKQGSPILGDRVYIGPGAAVIGAITVGNDALIGVGSIVTRSVPPRGVIVGNPGRILSCRGSFGLISYPGMDADLSRLASLAAAEQTHAQKQTSLPMHDRSNEASLQRPDAVITGSIERHNNDHESTALQQHLSVLP